MHRNEWKGEQEFVLDEFLQVEGAGQRQDVFLALGVQLGCGRLAGDEAKTAGHGDSHVQWRETALALERQRGSSVEVQPDLGLHARPCSPRACHRHPVVRRRRGIGRGRIAEPLQIAQRPFARQPGAIGGEPSHVEMTGLKLSGTHPARVYEARFQPRCDNPAVSAPRLILASTSRYRKELLSRLHLPFEVQAPEVDETPGPSEAPAALARRLATAKAEAIAARAPDAVVIGSDQVADLDGTCIGKPGSHERATDQLRSMRGRSVVFHTAVAVVSRDRGYARTEVASVTVRFREAAPTARSSTTSVSSNRMTAPAAPSARRSESPCSKRSNRTIRPRSSGCR
jgi:MAF protein